jgi:glycosyltransferase involved in cell wall biosynthesis
VNLKSPKVSVICLCFNHQDYVVESMTSALNQTYQNYELIVVDDGSSDDSAGVIERFISQYSQIKFIRLANNQGVCKAFNIGLASSTGDFIIDLAADDLLLPQRLEKGIQTFELLSDNYGVIFSDAEWIDKQGKHLYFHSTKFPHHSIPQGNIYKDLIEQYFICSPTMMFRRQVIQKLGGYDELLTYEDFDFWIRSSRHFNYFYSPEVSVKKRKLQNSLSHTQFKLLNKQGDATYRVCNKILELNENLAERDALQRRIYYEIRQSIRTLNLELAYKYLRLALKNKSLRYNH